MVASDATRILRDLIADFYADGGKYFWQTLMETPRAAIAAFKRKPEVFGSFAAPFRDWPNMRRREQERLSGLLERWIGD